MSDLTDDLSPGGHPLVEITNLRDDQYFESCIWVDLFTEWSGSDVNIVRGRGYGFVTIADTTWNPTEYSNEAKAGVVRHLTDAHDIEIKVGSSSEQTRKPAWQMANGRWHIADGTWHMANGKEDYDDIVFTAYRPDDPYDVLIETMIGCGRAIKDDMAAVWFDVGNFATPWADGDRVLVLVEALRHGTDHFAVVDITLDRTVDIQDVGEIMLTAIPQPQQRTGMVEWDGIDNECIVGYSVYHRDKRLNETIVAASNYEYSGIVNIRPVFVVWSSCKNSTQ